MDEATVYRLRGMALGKTAIPHRERRSSPPPSGGPRAQASQPPHPSHWHPEGIGLGDQLGGLWRGAHGAASRGFGAVSSGASRAWQRGQGTVSSAAAKLRSHMNARNATPNASPGPYGTMQPGTPPPTTAGGAPHPGPSWGAHPNTKASLGGAALGALAGGAIGGPLGALHGAGLGGAAGWGAQTLHEGLRGSGGAATPAAGASGEHWVDRLTGNVSKAYKAHVVKSNFKTALGTLMGGATGAAAGMIGGAPGMLAGGLYGARRGYNAARPRTIGEHIAHGINTVTPAMSNAGQAYLKYLAGRKALQHGF